MAALDAAPMAEVGRCGENYSAAGAERNLYRYVYKRVVHTNTKGKPLQEVPVSLLRPSRLFESNKQLGRIFYYRSSVINQLFKDIA